MSACLDRPKIALHMNNTLLLTTTLNSHSTTNPHPRTASTRPTLTTACLLNSFHPLLPRMIPLRPNLKLPPGPAPPNHIRCSLPPTLLLITIPSLPPAHHLSPLAFPTLRLSTVEARPSPPFAKTPPRSSLFRNCRPSLLASNLSSIPIPTILLSPLLWPRSTPEWRSNDQTPPHPHLRLHLPPRRITRRRKRSSPASSSERPSTPNRTPPRLSRSSHPTRAPPLRVLRLRGLELQDILPFDLLVRLTQTGI
jgi:hypothetical protein